MKKKTPKPSRSGCSIRFESCNIEALYPILDAISWLDKPGIKQVSQFAGVDPRTSGKLIKNAELIGLIGSSGDSERFVLKFPYPVKGSNDQKQAVVKDALLRMPLIINIRQFLSLGDKLEGATRKASTVTGIENFDMPSISPLLKWAEKLDALDVTISVENIVEEIIAHKEERHRDSPKKVVAFLSHSSIDKTFTRQLASDLERFNVGVWLDEHQIAVGDSIPEKISQGLAESDYFLIILSENSVGSEWVKRELNSALLTEIERKKAVVLPVKISDCKIPELIKDKRFADFSKSYKSGLGELIAAMKRT